MDGGRSLPDLEAVKIDVLEESEVPVEGNEA